MVNNGQIAERDAPIRLNDIRMSAFERADAQRHINAGVALADVLVWTSRRLRSALGAISNAFREAIPH